MKKIVTALTLFLLSAVICHAVTVENPRQDLYISPGSTAVTKFNVINRSNKEETMKVYQTDYEHKADGSNSFPHPGSHERSNAKWLKFSPEQFTIKPGAMIEINVQVNVPNEPLSGTYWSLLMVEYVNSSSTTAKTGSELESGINVKRRQGVHVRTHVTGTGEKAAKFTNKQLRKENGENLFEVDLENTGQVFYRGNFWVELFNQEGYPIRKINLPPRGVYPGCSVRFSAKLTGVKKGRYTALCVFDTLSNKVFGGKYQLDIP